MIKVFTHFEMGQFDVEPFLMRALRDAIVEGQIIKHDLMHVIISHGQAMKIPGQKEAITLNEGIYGRLHQRDMMEKPSNDWIFLGSKDDIDDICEYLAHKTPKHSKYELLVSLVEGTGEKATPSVSVNSVNKDEHSSFSY